MRNARGKQERAAKAAWAPTQQQMMTTTANYGGEERATAALKSLTPRLTKTAGDGDDGAGNDATGERTKLIEH